MYNFPVCISVCRAADWLDACHIDPTIVPVLVRVDQSFDRPVTLAFIYLHVYAADLFCFSVLSPVHLSFGMTYHSVVPFWVLGAGIHPDNQSGRRLVQKRQQRRAEIQRTWSAEHGVKVVCFIAGSQLNLLELRP